MNPFTKDVLGIINALLPGFVAAWIFYGLTPHPKKEPFERVVQALIFTGIVQAIVFIVGGVLLLLGRLVSIGEWTEKVQFVWSIGIAAVIGLVVAGLANNDLLHSWLRERDWYLYDKHETAKKAAAAPKRHWIWTARTSYPSEWFHALNQDRRWVILHLKDRRRLHGWPAEMPDQPDGGHFVIWQPEWLLSDGQRAMLYNVERMIVPVSKVVFVEVMRTPEEIAAIATPEQVAAAEKLLIETNQEESSDGEPSTTITEG